MSRLLGLLPDHVGSSMTEKLISALGAFLNIFLCLWLNSELLARDLVQLSDSVLIIASAGATSVLVFAVPHGKLSQPWSVIGGHLVSAVIGVACFKVLGNTMVSAALAVALAILLMQIFDCLHPPGGATALLAVIGSQVIHDLGWWFVLMPVGISSVVMVAVGIGYNSMFHWRRYPLALHSEPRDGVKPAAQVITANNLSGEDINQALEELDTFVDVSTGELLEIYQLAQGHANKRKLCQRSSKY